MTSAPINLNLKSMILLRISPVGSRRWKSFQCLHRPLFKRRKSLLLWFIKRKKQVFHGEFLRI